ncbi:MAG: hypothetical protein E4H36_09620 [Spirochaetales bacterium]|nr:MAG: hypothetical protein E4H36_09620 [Spirochaetales bacterium]
MLHDPGSYTPPLELTDIPLTAVEKDTLKKLGQELAGIAALPVHREKAELWQRLNDRNSVRPMVWINEIPWHEMNVNGELTLRTEHSWAQELELKMRRTIYQWKHMPADMIVNDYIDCPLAIHSTDFGIIEDVDIVKTDEKIEIVSRHFNIQIREPEDISRIQMPKVTHNKRMTELTFVTMTDIFKDIIPVKKAGQTHIWFTPWDYLIRWWGLTEAMMDLMERPDMVHAAVDRLTDAWMTELDQFVDQNLLSLDCSNTRIGSGGYGYVSDLPGKDFDPGHVKPHNMWGCSNAQIFAEVSPDMHWEFALEHDMRWLSRWGLSYYGCCEGLDKKIHLLKKIPNLRKFSVSPWNDMDRIVAEAGDDYVLSIKPNPAIFVDEVWSPERARADIQKVMDAAGRTCHLEFIMKDISTVRYRPQLLWEWAAIAMDLAEKN